MRKTILFIILIALLLVGTIACKKEDPFIRSVIANPPSLTVDQTSKITVDVVNPSGAFYYVEYTATSGYFAQQGLAETIYYPTEPGIHTITVRLLSLDGSIIYDDESITVEVYESQ